MESRNRRSFLLSASAAAVAAGVLTRRIARAGGLDGRFGVRAALADSAGFVEAVRRGDAAEVRRRLDRRPELATTGDGEGRSVLVVACAGGHAEVVAALLPHVPELDLMEACMVPDWERAEALLSADPSAVNRRHPVGGTALFGAALAGNRGLWRLQFQGGDPDLAPGPDSAPPAFGALAAADPSRAWICLIALLANGGDASVTWRGETLLHAAARRGDVRHVRYLLRRGLDPEALDGEGRSAARVADAHGHASASALLREAAVPRDDRTLRLAYDAVGAPVRWPDLSDLSAAEQSAVTGPSHRSLDDVRAICDDDPRRSFARSAQDELAVEAAAHVGRREVIEYHLAHGVPESLCTAIAAGHLARARALLDRRPSAARERGAHDFPVTFYASFGGGSVEAAELLLARGADVDAETAGATALHHAAWRDQVDLAAFLLERGADPDAVGYPRGDGGQTPLDVAEGAGSTRVAGLLRARGARR